MLRCALYRIPIVLEPFDAERTAATIEREAITIVSLVPTMLARLLDADAPVDRLRCAVIGGAPAAQSLIERALAAGAPVAPTYGLTETASQVATMPPGEVRERPGSAGPPILSTEVRIDDEGRICVRGPTVAPGVAGEDGWLVTGDLGRMDEDGYLYVLGRADDVIVTGGKNVSPGRGGGGAARASRRRRRGRPRPRGPGVAAGRRCHGARRRGQRAERGRAARVLP